MYWQETANNFLLRFEFSLKKLLMYDRFSRKLSGVVYTHIYHSFFSLSFGCYFFYGQTCSGTLLWHRNWCASSLTRNCGLLICSSISWEIIEDFRILRLYEVSNQKFHGLCLYVVMINDHIFSYIFGVQIQALQTYRCLGFCSYLFFIFQIFLEKHMSVNTFFFF